MDMARGPRYKAYSELRETKLRMKYQRQQEEEEEKYEEVEPKLPTPPPRKQVKFQGGLASVRKGSSSVLAQSVPDFSAALRKENRKPVNNVLPSVMELTPPSKKYQRQQEEEEEKYEEVEPKLPTPPPRKQVKFQGGLASVRKGSSSVLAQSVPDFSAALRKENRKPVNNVLPSVMELTPPSKSFNKGSNGVLTSSRGSVSASGGEKRRGGGGVLMARKSYASIDELKSFSKATACAINGELSRGGKNSRLMGKTVLGYRQF